jgi:predicted exporter
VAFAAPLLALMRNGMRLRWGVLVVAGIAAGSIVLHRGAYWEDQLSSMSPIAAADLAVDARLRREIGAPDVRHLLVVEADSAEAALVASERVAALLRPLIDERQITGFDTPARFLPSVAMQERRRGSLPEPAALAASLAQAVQGTPFRADSFSPFLADVAAARNAPPLRRADLDGTGLALQVDSLLLHRGVRFAALLPLQGVGDPDRVASAVAGFGVPGLVFVDLRKESDDLLGSYRSEAVSLSMAGSLVIVLLLAFALRRPGRIAAVLLPLAAAVVCTAAIDLAVSQRLSIFNLFGLLLVVAVGSNYALFFERGVRHPDAEGTRVVASLLLADICTVIGFGVLGFSAVPVLSGIGATVAIGACLSLVFSAIIGPRAA